MVLRDEEVLRNIIKTNRTKNETNGAYISHIQSPVINCSHNILLLNSSKQNKKKMHKRGWTRVTVEVIMAVPSMIFAVFQCV